MASVAQLEAFDWWLDQPREDRTAARLAEIRRVPYDTARKWVTTFNKRLGDAAERSIRVKIRDYVAEFEEVQRISVEGGVAIVEAFAAHIETVSEMVQNGAEIDVRELCRLASGLRTAYTLVERASCADVAKERAKRGETPWWGEELDLDVAPYRTEWNFPRVEFPEGLDSSEKL